MSISITRLAAVCTLSLSLVNLGAAGFAHAGVIATESLLPSARAEDLATVHAALDRSDVRQQFEKMGVAPDAVDARIANLTDQELHRLAQDLGHAPAAGDGLLAVLGIVFVVLIVLELTGVIDIFKKT